MKLLACKIENFGCLSDLSYQFQEGLTVIERPNGSGKSTFAAFIKAMLYGFPKTGPRSAAENERKKYCPWQGGTYGGSLDLEVGGRAYRVYRSFGKTAAKDEFSVRDLTNREECSCFDENLGEKLFELDAESFQRSIYMTQTVQKDTSVTTSIQTKLSNLVDNADDLNQYDKAQEHLKKVRTTYRKLKGSGGRIDDLTEKLEAVEQDLLQTEQQKQELAEVTRQAEQLGEEKKRQEKAFESLLQAITQAAAREKTQEERRELAERKREFESAQEALRRLDAEYPKGYPKKAELLALRDQAARYRQARRELESLEQGSAPENNPFGVREFRRKQELDRRFASGTPTREELASCRDQAAALRERRRDRETCRLSQEEEARLQELSGEFGQDAAAESSRKQRGTGWVILLAAGALMLLSGIGLLINKAVVVGILLLAAGCGAISAGIFSLRGRKKKQKEEAQRAERKQEYHELIRRKDQMRDRQAECEEEIRQLEHQLELALEPYHCEENKDFSEQLAQLTADQREWESIKSRWSERKCELERVAEQTGEQLQAFAKTYGFSNPADEQQIEKWIEEEAKQAHLSEQLLAAKERLERYQKEHPNMDTEAQGAPLQGDGGQPLTVKELMQKQDIMKQRLSETRENLARLNHEQKQREAEVDRIPDLLDQREALRQQRAEAERACGILDKTSKLLEQAKGNLSHRYVGTVEQHFERYAGRLLGSHTAQALVNRDLTLQVEEKGSVRELGCFSAGTADLLLLCMRFALADALFTKEQPFLILDDPFVNLDDAHTELALDLLWELGGERQILYMVCNSSRNGAVR